ncbi:MAG: MgtC/SapB family protein [Candidatus Omnitrophica bacterium]|nr:MgtC/SapB family protein [Candidatus Omnitrophota bacterium]
MLSLGDVALRLIVAMILGGVIGLEREQHGRAAGLRTHILVCISSALIMMTSIEVARVYGQSGTCDPSRIAAGVVMGIGFFGAGTIIRFKATVRGLTTAASLWTVAAIGLATGVGFMTAAVVVTALVLVTLVFFSHVEKWMMKHNLYRIEGQKGGDSDA